MTDTTGRIAGLLAEHMYGEFLASLGEVWTTCTCGAKVDATFGEGRSTEEAFTANWSAHVAAVIAEAGVGDVREAEAQWHRYIVLAERAEAALADLRERVRALADEWSAEAPSLVRNAYSGRDVIEGVTLERCADDLHALLDGNA